MVLSGVIHQYATERITSTAPAIASIVGFCLANITGDGIANLPLIGILDEHKGQKLSKPLVKAAVLDIVKLSQGGIIELNELNASLDLNMMSAVKMYESAGFSQSYKYSQAYLPKG